MSLFRKTDRRPRGAAALLLGAFTTITAFATLPASPAASGPAPSPSPRDPAPPPASAVASAVQDFRYGMGLFRWKIKTTLTVDGNVRIVKVEEVRVGPDGNFVREKTSRFERKPLPTPYPYGDPRRSLPEPPSQKEEDALWDQAQNVVAAYLRVSPDRVSDWSARCSVLARDTERDGAVRWQGRGLVRSWDDVVAWFDPSTRMLKQVEVKTTASADRMIDIAFLRVVFGTRPSPRGGQQPVPVIEDVFLNMTRGSRKVVVEIDASDFRAFS